MVPKQITRLLKRVSLLLGELAVFPLGFFLSYKLIIPLDSFLGDLAGWLFLGGLLSTIAAFVLLRRKTRAWKFAYDVEGWWVEREGRRLHPKRVNWERRVRRVLIWVPSGAAAAVLVFFPATTHVVFPRAAHLRHYQVHVPITWTILPSFSTEHRSESACVSSSGVGRYGVMQFWKPQPFTALVNFWCPRADSSTELLHHWMEERVKKSTNVSRREFALGRTTLTCWEYLPPDSWRAWRVLPPGYWEVQCDTPVAETERGLSVMFYGRSEDLPALYEVVGKIKQVD